MTRNTWFRTEGNNSCGSIGDRTMGHLLSQLIDGLINGSMTQQISAFVSIGSRAMGAFVFLYTHTPRPEGILDNPVVPKFEVNVHEKKQHLQGGSVKHTHFATQNAPNVF